MIKKEIMKKIILPAILIIDTHLVVIIPFSWHKNVCK